MKIPYRWTLIILCVNPMLACSSDYRDEHEIAHNAELWRLEQYMPYWKPLQPPLSHANPTLSPWHARLNPNKDVHAWGSMYSWESKETVTKPIEKKSSKPDKASKSPRTRSKKPKIQPKKNAWECSLCLAKYKSISLLSQHIIHVHWTCSNGLPDDDKDKCHEPYECSRCPTRFSSRHDAIKHAKQECCASMSINKQVRATAETMALEMRK